MSSPHGQDLQPDDLARLARLQRILTRARRGLRQVTPEDLEALPRLYRHAASVMARLESRGASPRAARRARALFSGAHALLYRERVDPLERVRGFLRFLLVEAPRTVRAEWRFLLLTLGLLYGLAATAYVLVGRDLDLAYSLLSPDAVRNEIQQLEETSPGEPFRGNFTFGLGESSSTAGWIMVHNMQVGVLYFVSALVPPLYLTVLSVNALMLGTYVAVAGHWDQAGSISSVLWCHGVLEIQALVLAGTAGLLLVRGILRPGARRRRDALRHEGRRSLAVLGPAFPLLFLAGLIEGFVSPHAPLDVRLAVAVGTGILLLTWVLLGDRLVPLRAREP